VDDWRGLRFRTDAQQSDAFLPETNEVEVSDGEMIATNKTATAHGGSTLASERGVERMLVQTVKARVMITNTT
jgi:hypothetical protein